MIFYDIYKFCIKFYSKYVLFVYFALYFIQNIIICEQDSVRFPLLCAGMYTRMIPWKKTTFCPKKQLSTQYPSKTLQPQRFQCGMELSSIFLHFLLKLIHAFTTLERSPIGLGEAASA